MKPSLAAAVIVLAGAALTGCVSPHLEGLAAVECAGDDDCSSGQVCQSGVCGAPAPDIDAQVVDMADPADLSPPDLSPPDLAPPDQALPDVGLPDQMVDMGDLDMMVDMAAPDMAVDAEVDQAIPDMVVDAACVPDEVGEICDGVDNDCDDLIDETGAAGCDLAEVVVPACLDGACAIEGCRGGFVDADRVADNGCECSPVEGVDLPDADGLDSNCDGLDGDRSLAVFVSPEGNPGSMEGTADDPFTDLGAAIDLVLAADGARTMIILDGAGGYSLGATVVVPDGANVGIFGGFRYTPGAERPADWVRDLSQRPSVRATGPATPAFDVTEGGRLALDGVNVFNAGNPQPVAIRADRCGALSLRSLTVFANGQIDTGRAQDGQSFEDDNGAAAEDAPAGTDGAVLGGGGVPGASAACEADSIGGQGGAGAVAPAAEQGEAGQSAPGEGGGRGGAGATVDTDATAGGEGGSGAHGPHGVSGGVGGRFNLDAKTWLPGVGRAPGAGLPGGGGGGGGGGFSPDDGLSPVSTGGGGGGGGGCGGGAATNGRGGFATIGIMVLGACPVTLEDVTIELQSGGLGGPGGAGGLGGAGGPGGLAPSLNEDGVRDGANGGAGGPGGCGGSGAGGPGGPALGVLFVGVDAFQVFEGLDVALPEPAAGGDGGTNPDCARADDAAPAGPEGVTRAIGCCFEPDDCGALDCPVR